MSADDEKTMDDAPCHYNADSASGWAVGYNTAIQDLSPALADVRTERKRQIDVENWTPEHDDCYVDGELSRAASCYALAAKGDKHGPPPRNWPWSKKWWKPKNRRRNLVRAAALLVAEIERLDRDNRPTVSEVDKATQMGKG